MVQRSPEVVVDFLRPLQQYIYCTLTLYIYVYMHIVDFLQPLRMHGAQTQTQKTDTEKEKTAEET